MALVKTQYALFIMLATWFTLTMYYMFFNIQLKYDYEGYRHFPLPEPMFIFSGVVEGNKHWQGESNSIYPEITILSRLYCTETIHLCPFICTC